MDANIIELPLNLHHNIAVRGKYCLTDMVLNQKDYDLFSFSHYSNLICGANSEDIDYLDYDAQGSFFEDEGVISVEMCSFPKMETPFQSVDIVAYLCKLIRHKKYIMLFIDDYCNSLSPYFGKIHSACEYLLYGCRKDDARFLAYGSLGEEPICSKTAIMYDDIRKMFAESEFAFYIIEKREYSSPEPTTELLVSTVKKYLCSLYDEMSDIQSGIEATKMAVRALPILSERKKFTFLYRIVEFERMFALRLTALSDHGVLPAALVHTHSSLLDEYAALVRQWQAKDGGGDLDAVLVSLDHLISFEESELKKVVTAVTS